MKTRLKELRTSKKLTQTALSVKVGCSQNTISRIELERTNPDVEVLQGLANCFDVSIDYLLFRTDQKQPAPNLSTSPAKQRVTEYCRKLNLLSVHDREAVYALIEHYTSAQRCSKGE